MPTDHYHSARFSLRTSAAGRASADLSLGCREGPSSKTAHTLAASCEFPFRRADAYQLTITSFTLPSNYIGPLPFDFDDATQVTVTRYLPPPPEALSDDSSEEPTIHTAQAMTISTPTKADMSRPDQLIEANDPASYSPSHSHSREQSAASADHDNDFIVNLARIADRDDDHASKIWPRPRDSGEITRSANWVKERAAQYQSDLMREAEQGAGLEVSEFHLTDEVGGMYLDGFTPLADWMAAGCKLGADDTISGN